VKQLELLGKRLVRGALRVAIHSKGRDAGEVDSESVRKILVVRQDNRIGNLILQIPFLKGIKHIFPEAEITVLLGETFAELYSHIPEIHDRIIFPHKELARQPWKWLPFVRQLGRGGWDMAFECGHPHVVSLNNASLTYLSKAPFRVGFRRSDADIFLTVLRDSPGQVHYAKALISLLVQWQRNNPTFEMALPLPVVHRNAYKRVWERSRLEPDARVILIWLGGRHDKRWQIEFWGSVATIIATHFGDPLTPVIGVGPSERELATEFAKIPGSRTAIFDGPVEELWSFLDRCVAVISGDTGPMHLAVALGIPTLAFFKVDNVWEYGHNDGKWHRAIFLDDQDPANHILEFLKAIPEGTCPRSIISY
jgi:ADP-heptose:LPS heptosyltransferase